MPEQLALLDTGPKLTAAQQLILDKLREAGTDGLEASEAGAWAHSVMESRWRHSEAERCVYCPGRGNEILRALRAKGLARYRRRASNVPGVWLAVGVEAVAGPSAQDAGWQTLLDAGF